MGTWKRFARVRLRGLSGGAVVGVGMVMEKEDCFVASEGGSMVLVLVSSDMFD